MTCYDPLNGYMPETGQYQGRKLRFSPPGRLVLLPCGRCIGCRIDKTSEWAVRLVHEAQLHRDNAFITLTYETVPRDGSLQFKDLQLFLKKLRKSLEPKKIRFYACGEYGEKLHRPHYHALIFGHDFPDKKYWKEERKNIYYTSDKLTAIWGRGHCVIGNVDFQSAAYCARYVTKKINGDPWHNHYQHLDQDTGELHPIKEEFACMSRKPGIGNGWYQKYKADVFPCDFVVINGSKKRVPNYYLQLLKEENEPMYDQIKKERYKNMLLNAANNTQQRLETREICATARTDKLIKAIE